MLNTRSVLGRIKNNQWWSRANPECWMNPNKRKQNMVWRAAGQTDGLYRDQGFQRKGATGPRLMRDGPSCHPSAVMLIKIWIPNERVPRAWRSIRLQCVTTESLLDGGVASSGRESRGGAGRWGQRNRQCESNIRDGGRPESRPFTQQRNGFVTLWFTFKLKKKKKLLSAVQLLISKVPFWRTWYLFSSWKKEATSVSLQVCTQWPLKARTHE